MRLFKLLQDLFCFSVIPHSNTVPITRQQLSTLQRAQRSFAFILGSLVLIQGGAGVSEACGQGDGAAILRSGDAITLLQRSLRAMNDKNISSENVNCTLSGNLQVSGREERSSSIQQNEILWSSTSGTSATSNYSAAAIHSQSMSSSQRIGIANARIQTIVRYPQYALSRLLSDTSISLKLQPQSDGRIVLEAIQTFHNVPVAHSLQRWYFSPDSPLPAKVEYLLENPKTPAYAVSESIQYGSFQQYDGILSPSDEIIHVVSGETHHVTVTALACHPGVQP